MNPSRFAELGKSAPEQPVAEQPVAEAPVTKAPANAQPQAAPSQPEAPQDKFEAKLRENPGDFGARMGLLDLILKANPAKPVEEQRSSTESFLEDFPLCYGYWKKLCDLETKAGGPEAGTKILERGVQAIPNSIELWSYYCTFVAYHEEDLDAITQQFERAAEMVGSDYHAEKLWDKYVEYEAAQEEWENVTKLFHRILALPLKSIEGFWDKFTQHTNSHPPELGEAASAQEYMKQWEAVSNKAKEERAKTLHWESACKRSFFHANPLDETQQAAWRAYLAYAETEWASEQPRISKLYERCLVPCCVYPEFWIKYATFVEDTVKDVDRARSILSLASGVHLKRNPTMLLAHALFEERHEQLDKAEALYKVMGELAPALLEGLVHYANFMRRQGKLPEACAIYEAGIVAQTEAESAGFLVAHYARFASVVMGDAPKARSVFSEQAAATGLACGSKLFWEMYLETEARLGSKGVVQTVFEQATGEQSKLSSEQKLELYQWYIAHLKDFGSLHAFLEAEKAVAKLLPAEEAQQQKQGTKRPAESPVADCAEGAAKQAKTGQDTAAQWEAYNAQQQQWAAWQQQQAAAGAAPAAQQQWAGHYAGYPGYPGY